MRSRGESVDRKEWLSEVTRPSIVKTAEGMALEGASRAAIAGNGRTKKNITEEMVLEVSSKGGPDPRFCA
jgi:hypothetical protein